MTIGKYTPVYREVRKYARIILDGTVVSIDPSIGSNSSLPGYAVYRHGSLITSGTIPIEISGTVPQRLRELAYHIRKLYKKWEPVILIYEEIPSQRYGGNGNAKAHASLLKALGVILSISGPEGYVGIHPISWKKCVRSTYVKGDREDAEEIGWIVIQLARQIKEEEAERKEKRYKKREN